VQEAWFAGTGVAGPDGNFSVAAGLGFQSCRSVAQPSCTCRVPIPLVSLGVGSRRSATVGLAALSGPDPAADPSSGV
jgi:hypothetical protein